MEIKLLLKEKDRRILVDNFRTGTLLAQGGAPRGQSAYEQAVEGGYTGTKEEFEEALATNIGAIADIADDIETVSENISDVITTAENLSDIHTVAENVADVNTVATDISNVNTVAGISSDVTEVASISAAVSTVSGHDSEVTLVADNMASVMTTANSITDVQNVASDITNINTVAGISSDVSTVATNSAAVNTAATNIAAIIAAPMAAQNAATSATNAQTWAEGTDTAVVALGGEHSSKGWAGRAQQIVESLGAIYKPAGSITFASLPALSADVLGNVYNITDAFTTTADFVEGAGNNYPAGTNVAIVDVGTGGSHSYKFDVLSGLVDLSAYRTAGQQDVIDGNLSTAITNHTGNTSNPHSVTKAQVGLGNVDNTADLDKPISTATQTALNAKQDTLVSGTNIKTVNGNSLLGSGNVDIDALPSQTGQSGKFLTTNGTDASWANVDALPSQTGQSGKFLTTDGSAASWADIPTEVDNKSVTLNSNDEIQTVGVIDQNNPTKAIKKWTGTRAAYDAIVTKDPYTEYTTTDENETVYQNSYRIGQVLPSILPISDYGLHLLDGAVIDGTGIYSSFYSYIAGLVSTYPNLFISEADWQTAVTTYGVCGKFVYDSTNNTVRLPKVTGFIEGTTDVTALGDLVQAGLPNITGSTGIYISGGDGPAGAFYSSGSGNGGVNAAATGGKTLFDASRSSSIYGNSNTVQPQTIKVYYYIVIANSYQTPTGVQISKVATDLNGKVNLNSSWGMPGTNYEDLVVGASESSYIAPADGYYNFVYQGSNGQWIYLVNDTTQVEADDVIYGQEYARAFVPCRRGDSVRIVYSTNGAYCRLRFYYAQKDNN